MSFHNPAPPTAVPVSKVTAGTINALWTLGNPAGAHVEIGTKGPKTGVRLYAADGTTVLIDLDVGAPSVAGSTVTGTVPAATTAGTATTAGSATTAGTATSAGTVTGTIGASVALPGAQVTGTVPAATNATNQTGTGSIQGLFRIGNPAAAHAEIGSNGTDSGIRLYAADGVTKLIDLDATNGNATFGGVVNVKGTNGSAVRIAGASDALSYTTQYFMAPNGVDFAYINLISDASQAAAYLGINSGQYTPADTFPRRNRIFMTNTELRTEVMRVQNQLTMGGYASMTPTNGFHGYMDRTPGNGLSPPIFTHVITGPNLFSVASDTPASLIARINGSSIVTAAMGNTFKSNGTGTASLASGGGTVATVIPGSAITLSTTTATALIEVTANVDFTCSAAIAGVANLCVIELFVDGTAVSEQLLADLTQIYRRSYSRAWAFRLTTAGSHTFDIRIRKTSASTAVCSAGGTHSGLVLRMSDY